MCSCQDISGTQYIPHLVCADFGIWDCSLGHLHTPLKIYERVVCVYAYVDLDECLSNNGGCHSERKCTNMVGSMKCGDCAFGWTNDGEKGCKGEWQAPLGQLGSVASYPNSSGAPH